MRRVPLFLEEGPPDPERCHETFSTHTATDAQSFPRVPLAARIRQSGRFCGPFHEIFSSLLTYTAGM